MTRLLLRLGAACAIALSLSVGPPGAAASQGQGQEAVVDSPGQSVAFEETAAPLPHGALVVQETEASLATGVANSAPPPTTIGGAAFSAPTSVPAAGHQEAVIHEVAHHSLQ